MKKTGDDWTGAGGDQGERPDPRRSQRATTGRAASPRRTVDDRPPSGRERVPNRPTPARGRPAREQRPPRGWSAHPDDRSGQDSRQLVGAAPAAGGRQRAAQGSTRIATDPTRPARRPRPARKKQPRSQRGRRTRRDRGARVNTRLRTRGALGIVLVLLTVALVKLVTIQTVDANALATAGLDQKQRHLPTDRAARAPSATATARHWPSRVAGKQIAARPLNFENDLQRN